MINTNMRYYNYYLYESYNAYGQKQIAPDIKGQVKMAISLTSQNIQDNINYKNASYIGLTMDKSINDNYVIQYGEEKLKVIYVNSETSIYTQVFLQKI